MSYLQGEKHGSRKHGRSMRDKGGWLAGAGDGCLSAYSILSKRYSVCVYSSQVDPDLPLSFRCLENPHN